MRLVTIKVSPGAAYELAVAGDYVRVRESAVNLIIENTTNSEKIEVSQGDDFEFTPFQNLRISHDDAAEQTIKLIVSKGKKAGSAQVGGSVSLTGAVELGDVTLAALETINIGNKDAVNGAFTQGRVSVTNANQVLIAANANRRYLMLQNNDAAAVLRVTLNGNAATAAQGFRVQAGGVLEVPIFAVTGAINCMMETATETAGNVEFVEG
jgi:hypothetical protein